MIDLNDDGQFDVRHDWREVRERLAASARDWLPALYPQARPSSDRRTLRCADLSGRSPRKEGSCVIHLDGRYAGWGFDHATGESAGPIDLISHATGLSDAKLVEEALRLARLETPVPARRSELPKPDHSAEVARILAGCQPIAGTAGETYLTSRGLAVPSSADLHFHDDLTDYDAKRGWPGLVAVVRGRDGEPSGGIHRTFLLEDGSDKAPPAKKMLGRVGDGAVRLAPFPEDGHIGIAEGIETAMSAQVLFGLPVWAALSADGLRRWAWPLGTARVTIFADSGSAGQQAAASLADRLNLAGIENTIIVPLHGDDFNDDLRKDATARDYGLNEAGEDNTGEILVAASDEIVRTDLAPLSIEALTASVATLTNPPDLLPLSDVLGRVVQARLEPLPERQLLAAIKIATGIPVSVLEKQLGELRRRLNSTGDIRHRAVRPQWAGQLRLDLSGTPERNEANVITALTNDAAFAGSLVFDEFAQEVRVSRLLPWDEPTTIIPRPWEDGDDVRCAEWLQRREINVAPVVVGRSVSAVARDIRIHPVRDYLASLAWDGIPRIETWALGYLGAADTPLHRAFGALWLISAVARIMRAGSKVDHMLILEGPQGARKSTALRVLAGDDWFTDELAEIGSKDASQQMRGVWIIEIAELDAIGRAEVSRIKAFLTRTVDRYRPPYGRYVIDVPRQCVFAGSVNPDTYLRDETGNRRFWPVRCGDIDLNAIRRDRDQLWAEAASRYREGAVWWLTDPALIAMANKEQEARYQSDAWDELIERWLVTDRRRVNRGYNGYDDWQDEEVVRTTRLSDVSIGEILRDAIKLEPGRWTRADQMRVSAYLKRNGWERYRVRAGQTLEWRYRC